MERVKITRESPEAKVRMSHIGNSEFFDTAVAPMRPTKHSKERISGISAHESDEKWISGEVSEIYPIL